MYKTEITDSCAVPDRLEAINETLTSIDESLTKLVSIFEDATSDKHGFELKVVQHPYHRPAPKFDYKPNVEEK